MEPPLQLVTRQFPHLREQVAGLFLRDGVFRELCEDYESCASALARQPASEGLRREYAALQLRLENEMLRYLHEAADPAARPKK